VYETDSVLAVTSSSPHAWAAASHSALVVMSASHCPVSKSAPAPACPGGHDFAVKASHAAAPLPDMRPAAHASHAAAPLLDLWRPATHVVHVSAQRHPEVLLQAVLLLVSVLR
jgi:hypothetical protein